MSSDVILRVSQLSFWGVSKQHGSSDQSIYTDLMSTLCHISQILTEKIGPLTITVHRFAMQGGGEDITQTHVVRLVSDPATTTQLALTGYDLSTPGSVRDINLMIDRAIDSSSPRIYSNKRTSQYHRLLNTVGHVINTSFPTQEVYDGQRLAKWAERRLTIGLYETPIATIRAGSIVFHDAKIQEYLKNEDCV